MPVDSVTGGVYDNSGWTNVGDGWGTTDLYGNSAVAVNYEGANYGYSPFSGATWSFSQAATSATTAEWSLGGAAVSLIPGFGQAWATSTVVGAVIGGEVTVSPLPSWSTP